MERRNTNTVGLKTLALTLSILLACSCAAQQVQTAPQAPGAPTPAPKSSPIRSFMNWGKSLVTPASHEQSDFNLTPNSGVTKPVAGQVSPISHAAAVSSTIIELGPTESLAEIVAKTKGPVVIDFHASWCGPCKKQGKLLKEMEPYAIQNGAAIVKIDVDKHAALAKKLNISSLPTLMVIKNGALVNSKIGLADRQTVTGYLTATKR